MARGAQIFDEHLAEVCGFEILDHIHFGEITPGIRKDAEESCAEEVELAYVEQFAPQAVAGNTV